NEIVEYILFLLEHSGFVPFFSVFTSTTKIHHHIDASLFNEERVAHAETRSHWDVEATVSINQNWSSAIKLHTLLVSDEHRNFSTILAGEEHLLGSNSLQVEIRFSLPEQHRLA